MTAVTINPLTISALTFGIPNATPSTLEPIDLGSGAVSQGVLNRVGDLVFFSGRTVIGEGASFPEVAGRPFCLFGSPGDLPEAFLPMMPGIDIDEFGQTEWHGVGTVTDPSVTYGPQNQRVIVVAWTGLPPLGYPVLLLVAGEYDNTQGAGSIGFREVEHLAMTPFGQFDPALEPNDPQPNLVLHPGAMITWSCCYLAADADLVPWTPPTTTTTTSTG